MVRILLALMVGAFVLASLPVPPTASTSQVTQAGLGLDKKPVGWKRVS